MPKCTVPHRWEREMKMREVESARGMETKNVEKGETDC